MKRSVPFAALAAAFASSVAFVSLSGPVLAQSSAPAASAAAPAAAADPVVATVNGTPIRASELALAIDDVGPGLPPQLQGAAREEYVLSFLTDMTLIAQAAAAQKLDQTPGFQTRLAYLRTKALMEAMMNLEAKKAVTDELKRKTLSLIHISEPTRPY